MEKKTLKDRLNIAGRWALGAALGSLLAYGASKAGAEIYADMKINSLDVPEMYDFVPYESREVSRWNDEITPIVTKPGDSQELEKSVDYSYKLEETEEYKDYLKKVEDIKNGVNGNSIKILFALKAFGWAGGAVGGGYYYSRYRRRKKEGSEED